VSGFVRVEKNVCSFPCAAIFFLLLCINTSFAPSLPPSHLSCLTSSSVSTVSKATRPLLQRSGKACSGSRI